MERNYKVVKFLGKFYIQYEQYSYYSDDWTKALFRDMNGDDLEFIRKIDAENWIDARRNIYILKL